MAKGRKRDRLFLRGNVWWFWGYDVNGKRYQESTHQRDDKAAELVARQIERKYALAPHQSKRAEEAAVVTVEKALTIWMNFQKDAGRAENTLDATELHCGHLISMPPHLEHRLDPKMKIDDVKLVHTSAYVRFRLNEPGAGPGIRHTVSKELTALFAAMKRCAALELAQPRVYSALWPPELGRKVYKPRKRFLTVDEMQYLVEELEASNDHHSSLGLDRQEYLVMYTNTGMRLAELFDARPQHYDSTERDIFIDGTKTQESSRRVPLTSVAIEILERRIERTKDGVLFPEWENVGRDLKAACARIEARWNPEYHALNNEKRALIVGHLQRIKRGAGTADLAELVGITPHRVVWHLNLLRERGILSCMGKRVALKEGSGRGNQRNVAHDSRVWKLDPDGFKRAVQAVGGDLQNPRPRRPFPAVTPNDLRRTFCSWLCQRGVPERVAAELMGHKDTTMVKAVYGQFDLATKRHAIATLDRGPLRPLAAGGAVIRDMPTPRKPRKTA